MFDAVVLGTVVTDETIAPDSYVAIDGEKIADFGRGTPPPARTVFDRKCRPRARNCHNSGCSKHSRLRR